MQRIVLVASAKHLNGALQFVLAAYERVLLLVVVVHAGDQTLPCRLVGIVLCRVGLVVRLRSHFVVKVVESDELTHEAGFLAV